MTVDPAVVPGLLLLALELLALAAIGYVVARVALRQSNDLMALAQGLVIGPALWGLTANFLLHLVPGRAGALACLAITLALAAGLAWRSRASLGTARGTVAGFAGAALAVLGIALAARQQLTSSDAHIRFGLAAPIQAGAWPPILPWSPWNPVPYHYGADMLVGLLAPPTGPNLAFVAELLDAYAWTSLALLVGTTILRRGGWLSLLTLGPLLLTAGAWTQHHTPSPALLQLAAPAGFPEAGLRATLANVYWPPLEWPWIHPEPHAPPPNIWFAHFTLAYGLAITVLERVTDGPRSLGWLQVLALAAMVGFMGLIEEAAALTTLGLWGVAEAIRIVNVRKNGGPVMAGPAVVGLAASAFLLAAGGGLITGILTGTARGDTSIGWIVQSDRFRPLASVEPRPGGVALLSLGPASVSVAAVLLGLRQRLVLALAAGSAVFLLGNASLQSGLAEPSDIRLDGHAGNFALLALLIASAQRIRAFRSSWRYPVGALTVALIVLPTVALPIRTLGFQVSHGVDLANAQPHTAGRDLDLYRAGIGREPIERLVPDLVTRYVHNNIPIDARVFSPNPSELTLATGRPNASGFTSLLHYTEKTGPEYQDALRYLEPAAARRLGFAYVHATDAWIASLPKRAQGWLSDPRLFDLLVRDGTHALYRIRPAFLHLDPTPTPQSFEALRRTVPASAIVYISETIRPLDRLRLASALTHVRLTGVLNQYTIHPLSHIPIEPLGTRHPDIVIVARDPLFDISTHAFPQIWWNHKAVAYATQPSIAPTVAPPPPPEPDFTLRLSDVAAATGTIKFTATLGDHAPNRWTGQDWLVIPLHEDPWAPPIQFEPDGYTLVGALWFAGQIVPSGRTSTLVYEFDALLGTLAVQESPGEFTLARSSGDGLKPGLWVLAARLRQGYLQAAVIPALTIVVSEAGDVSYRAIAGERKASLNPCPEQLTYSDSCRRLAASAKRSA